jgi:hypothetical protein
MDGDGVLERILFPIVEYSMIIKREKPSEVGTTENELRYSIPGAPCIIKVLLPIRPTIRYVECVSGLCGFRTRKSIRIFVKIRYN